MANNLSSNNNTTDKESITRWLKGIPYEVAFWRSYYGNRKRRNDLFSWSLYGKCCVLDNFDIDAYIAALNTDSPKILDVGCALSYAFGNIINGKDAHVVYVDPLAPFYNEILRHHNIDRPAISFGMIESLSAAFAPDSTDFIHVRNALDHCADPFEGIVQSLVVLKKGGVLYLNHFRNEAQNEGYRGFHQFNLSEESGNLILWNKDTTINVTKALNGFADVNTTVTDAGRIVAVITKTDDIPEELYSVNETARRQSEMLMATAVYFHRLGNSTRYQLSRFISTLGHRTMRLMPYSILNRIKRLASK